MTDASVFHILRVDACSLILSPCLITRLIDVRAAIRFLSDGLRIPNFLEITRGS